MVDGHVKLVDKTVFVSDVNTVEDVSTATGNIEYHGNVEVNGNVCENFSVRTDVAVCSICFLVFQYRLLFILVLGSCCVRWLLHFLFW